jgi:NADH:ubiquinone reductase (H+-translocating)
MTAMRRRVVILGGGYAGVRAAYDLAHARKPEEVEILLVSESPHHLETPLLYEVATAYLDRESTLSSEHACEGVMVELADIFAKQKVGIKIGRVVMINQNERMITLHNGSTVSFDYLIVALGATTATYNIPGITEYAFTVKTLSEALRLRHHVVRLLRNPKRDAPAMLTFVVIGAGATGVETAAELAHLVRRVVPLDSPQPRIVLLEAGPTILREVPEAARRYAETMLKQWGVEIMVNRTITALEEKQVIFQDGGMLAAGTMIWAGGLSPLPVIMKSHFPLERWGIAVSPTLQVKGLPHIFAAGDTAVLAGSRIPATVPVAYSQGALCARNCLHLLRGEALETYEYQPQGQLITLGGKRGIVLFKNGKSMTGRIPWVIKKMVSLRYWLRYLTWAQALQSWTRGISIQSQND